MKKIYFLALSLITAATLNAQLTLTQAAYENVIGDIEYDQQCDSVAAIPKNVGQNQLWDFSAIVQTAGSIDTTYYVATTGIPSASLFPGATLASYTGNEADPTYNFWKSSASPAQFESLGNYDLGTVVNYTNTEVPYTWPIAYGYSHTDTYSGPISGSQTSGTHEGTLTVSATGSGTVIMPGGTHYTNVLQLKTSLVDIQISTAGNLTITGTSYAYIRAGEKSAFISVGYDVLAGVFSGAIAGVSTSTTINTTNNVGIKTVNALAQTSVFPNPAKSTVNIVLSNPANTNCTIRLYNILGGLEKEVNAGNATTINSQISVADLKAGVYFVKIAQGSETILRKLVIE